MHTCFDRPLQGSRQEGGFTLLELIVTISILTVLTSIAIPNFLSWFPRLRLKEASTELLSDMYQAKAQAVKRNKNVVIDFDTVSCSPLVPNGKGSYKIFIDDDKDNTLDASETTLKERFMPKDVALCSENETFGGNTGFTSRGFPIALNTGDIYLKNTDDRAYKISLNAAGTISLN